MAKKTKNSLGYKKYLLYLAVAVILLAVLVPQREQLIIGLKAIPQADAGWLLMAIGFLFMTYLISAMMYKVLARKRLKIFTTLLVQIATSFTNRVVPAGLGGLGLNTDYLIKTGHTPVESATIVGINSLVAFLSYNTLIIASLFLGGVSFSKLSSSSKIPWWVLIVFFIVFITSLSIVLKNKKIKAWLSNSAKEFKQTIALFKKQPIKLILAYLGATSVTLFFVLTLYSCAQAVGLDVTYPQAFIGYTAGIVIGAAVLTPGGLGGVEAGLYGAFVAYGNQSSLVFAAIITYRLLSYWLPILPGFVCFWWLRHKIQV